MIARRLRSLTSSFGRGVLSRGGFAGALAILVFGLSSALALETGSLEIVTKSGVYPFTVEIAQNDQERATGLMNRRSLPEGSGMLFDFKQEGPVSFWMKNTFISLDMIFIRGDGSILRIAQNTEPLSEKMVPSGGAVRAVLEVIAGTSRKYGIAPGDRVAHPIFQRR